MKYEGVYECFDFSRITTYPIAERNNVVNLSNMIDLDDLVKRDMPAPPPDLERIAAEMRCCRTAGSPVIVFTGAHLIKNGLSPILAQWMREGWITHLATNGAGAIHDMELAMIGETSEDVPDALRLGKFGFADETGRTMNRILRLGNEAKLGFGECLGAALNGKLAGVGCEFPRSDKSLMATAYSLGVPFTVHVAIGADIVNAHPDFDGEVTGGTSGRDFGIFVAAVEKCRESGMFLNIGSAVMGPEVMLKAVSAVANAGAPPIGLVTAVFDFREVSDMNAVQDSECPAYYFRDLKSVVARIPEAFEGTGYYISGDIRETVPQLFRLMEK